MFTLAEEIERDQKDYISGQAVYLWLPKDAMKNGRDTPDVLHNTLKTHTLEEIAHSADDHEKVESLFNERRTRQSNFTNVIAELRPQKVGTSRVPQEEQAELDDIVTIINKFQNLVKVVREGKSPFVNANSRNYYDRQKTEFPVLDGRYTPDSKPTVAPPIELYHPVFPEFLARLRDKSTDIPEEVIRKTAAFVRSVSTISLAEQARSKDSRKFLSEILDIAFSQVNFDRSSSAQIAQASAKRVAEQVALALVEETGELGMGGTEPSVQGSFSYTKFWSDDGHQKVREGCCCPSFIIALAGPWLVVLGAVFTSQVVVQRLTDYLWLGNSRVNDDTHVLDIARVLYALQGSLRSLEAYYETFEPLPAPENCLHPRFFPSITSFLSGDTHVTFTYIRPLELDDACVTFLASLDEDDRHIVVKFVPRYAEVAHRILADLDLAPNLIHCGAISEEGLAYGELRMVVMDFVEGKTLAALYNSGELSRDIKAAVRRGIEALHDEDLVYGDIRRPNIMIVDPTGSYAGASLGERVRFLDFDWAGKLGKVRYPLHLCSYIRETAGVLDYDMITKEHDIRMLASL
ncbi:hypothetical protein Hypma_005976 [Hypsizygus marmoreus]|uniref:Protein kinase domain-containing protein n=1 Tax=Hypsizygus marmoreus TaxID=39966 RepID=A0A369KAB6_HYPMA|nr:hypothetical protein Hypma_005976 [Hypsizygus marmoreus]